MAAGLSVPAELPIAVDVNAIAGLVGRGLGRRLSVLTPEAIGGLAVEETCNSMLAWMAGKTPKAVLSGLFVKRTIWVHDGEDVKVVLVEERLHRLVGILVALDQLQSDVLDSLAGNVSFYLERLVSVQ